VKLSIALAIILMTFLFPWSLSASQEMSVPDNALPINGRVVAGSASISQANMGQNSEMVIRQTSGRAVIEWDGFNIGKNSSVLFITPDSMSGTLNRVRAGSVVTINGKIKSNGRFVISAPPI
jgi:large exoprotein involved in heme utilization and adhesion